MKKVNITVECLPEDCPLEGNASAIDEVTDKKTEDRIIESYNNGNEWAWCTVKVTAKIDGIDLEGTDYLGCCSYESREDFINNSGYYADMVEQAKADLLEKIGTVKALVLQD